VAAVEIFLPHPPALQPGEPSPFAIASLHAETRRDSIAQALETVRFADRHAIPWVLLPAARIDDLPRAEVLTGRRGAADFAAGLARLGERRQPLAAAHRDAFFMLLSRVLAVAERYATRIGILAGGLPESFPWPGEVVAALREFRGAPLAPWLDLAARAGSLERGFAGEGAWEPVAKAAEGAVLREVPAARDEPRALLSTAGIWVFDPDRGPDEDPAELAPAAESLLRLAQGEPEAEPGRRRSILDP
jgi:hypothetical protein